MLPVRAHRLTVVATTPVLSDDVHRDEVRAVLQPLGVEAVVLIDGVKAAAFGAGVDVCEPLLVVDVGAQLTEIALIVQGAVVQARRTEVELGHTWTVVDVVGEAMLDLLQGPCGSQMVDALDRGVLFTGGGALRPEITYKLGRRLAVVVRPAPAAHTAAVRGAGAALWATQRHPTSSPSSP